MFPPAPPEAHAWAAGSADLPPLCSQPAGSHSFFASATSIMLLLPYHIFSPLTRGNLNKSAEISYSVRNATTGSFFAATREGISPAMMVSRALIATRATAP